MTASSARRHPDDPDRRDTSESRSVRRCNTHIPAHHRRRPLRFRRSHGSAPTRLKLPNRRTNVDVRPPRGRLRGGTATGSSWCRRTSAPRSRKSHRPVAACRARCPSARTHRRSAFEHRKTGRSQIRQGAAVGRNGETRAADAASARSPLRCPLSVPPLTRIHIRRRRCSDDRAASSIAAARRQGRRHTIRRRLKLVGTEHQALRRIARVNPDRRIVRIVGNPRGVSNGTERSN